MQKGGRVPELQIQTDGKRKQTVLVTKEENMENMENIYMNRELSWLKFNERVIEEAENPEVPLCERMNFVSIYQSNLD